MKEGGERLTGQIEVTKDECRDLQTERVHVVDVILLYRTYLLPCILHDLPLNSFHQICCLKCLGISGFFTLSLV